MTEYEAAKEVIREMYGQACEQYAERVREWTDEAYKASDEDRASMRENRRAAFARRHVLGTLVEQLDMRVEYKMSGMDWDRKE